MPRIDAAKIPPLPPVYPLTSPLADGASKRAQFGADSGAWTR